MGTDPSLKKFRSAHSPWGVGVGGQNIFKFFKINLIFFLWSGNWSESKKIPLSPFPLGGGGGGSKYFVIFFLFFFLQSGNWSDSKKVPLIFLSFFEWEPALSIHDDVTNHLLCCVYKHWIVTLITNMLDTNILPWI